MQEGLHAIILFAVVLYGLQFFVDFYVFSLPVRRVVRGEPQFLSFNAQKKATFFMRVLNGLLLPLSGYIVDSQPDAHSLRFLLVGMFASCVVGTMLAGVVLLGWQSKWISKRHFPLAAWSTLYGAHLIGLPLTVAAAVMLPDYRATIIQLNAVINLLSNVVQVWLVDRKVMEALETQSPLRAKEAVRCVWVGRVAGKLMASGFGILGIAIYVH